MRIVVGSDAGADNAAEVAVEPSQEDTIVVVDLRGLKRPFPALKALDMDNVIRTVLEALQGKGGEGADEGEGASPK